MLQTPSCEPPTLAYRRALVHTIHNIYIYILHNSGSICIHSKRMCRVCSWIVRKAHTTRLCPLNVVWVLSVLAGQMPSTAKGFLETWTVGSHSIRVLSVLIIQTIRAPPPLLPISHHPSPSPLCYEKLGQHGWECSCANDQKVNSSLPAALPECVFVRVVCMIVEIDGTL